jgi:circadian clock protein KaiC
VNKMGYTHYKTEIPGFDDLFENGIPLGSTILVEGGPGSGKTIMCLQMCYNACKQGKKALYMTFEEPEDRLKDHLKSFGFDYEKYEKKGLLRITRFSAIDIAKSVEALLTEAKKELLIDVQPILIPKDFAPDIVVMDSLSAIASAFSGEKYRFRIYMEQLFRYLETHDITSFLITETPHPTHIGLSMRMENEAVSFLSDGIISIYNVFHLTGLRERALEVVKMRGENIRRKLVKMDIGANGIEVYPQMPLKGEFKLT